MRTPKNYSYFAVQLGKVDSRWAKRTQQHVLVQLGRINALVSGIAAAEPLADAAADAALQPLGREAADLEHEPLDSDHFFVAEPMDNSWAGWEIGAQALASIVGLQLRFALRRWETFVRRKRFDELQSKVVLTLQNVSAPAAASAVVPEAATTTPKFLKLGQESFDFDAVELDAEASANLVSTSPLSRPHATRHLRAEPETGAESSPAAITSDEAFVKSLSDDQARVDEIIKLSALLWESGSLVHVQPMALLKASLLVRVAERCQKHVMREAVQWLWKCCSLQRSVEELLARGEFVKRSDEVVAQLPRAEVHQPQHQLAEGPCDEGATAVSRLTASGPEDVARFDAPISGIANEPLPNPGKHHEEKEAEKVDMPVIVTQPSSKPGLATLPSESNATAQRPLIDNKDVAVRALQEEHLPEDESGTSGEESEINDDDLADLLG